VTEGASATSLILSSNRPSAATGRDENRPRTDFEVLARQIGGRILYPGGGARGVALLQDRLRIDFSQAVRARRARASAYVSFSERVGMPLSLLRPHAPHLLIAHLLTSRQKRLIAKTTRFLERTDMTLVFSRAQERYLREEVGLDHTKAKFIWDKVDHSFFTPGPAHPDGGYVLSVGREQRDYQTLVDAVRPLRIRCIIVAGSTWSHRAVVPLSLPDHVELRQSLDYAALRELYRGARVVAVPVLPDVDYAAGVNCVLEAMSCARPVVVSDTPGLDGYVRDGEDGRLVPAGDSESLRKMLCELWEDSSQADRLASAGRSSVERERTVDHFAARVAEMVGSIA
jgi:glycosyltransferase involved in cell wall biosynthesis